MTLPMTEHINRSLEIPSKGRLKDGVTEVDRGGQKRIKIGFYYPSISSVLMGQKHYALFELFSDIFMEIFFSAIMNTAI